MKKEDYLARLDEVKKSMIDRVIQWANINSHSFNVHGLNQMSNSLIEAFDELDCEREIVPLGPIVEFTDPLSTTEIKLGSMLRFRKRSTAPIQVLLVGHMDTVFGLSHSFQTTIRKNDHSINGPGVTDMKGGLCVMLEALKTFEQSSHNNQLGWEVLINPDEEIGSLGSASFLAERAKHHQVGLLFEPAMDEEGTLAGTRKGSGNFTVIVYGRSAHAGRDFIQGRNAIAALAEIMSKIHDLNGKREGVTLNIGHVQGGGSVNVVPPSALCRLDVRILKEEDTGWVQENLTSILASINQREGFKTKLVGGFHRKPKMLTGKTQRLYDLVAEIGKEIGQSITWKPSGGCCDGNNLSEVGLPNVDTLGVCGGKIHSEEEYLLVDSLISRSKLTAMILLRLSEGKF